MDGGSSTQTPTVPPPTPEETQLTQSQIALANAQLAALKQSTDFQQQLFDATSPLIKSQTALAQQQLQRANSPEAKQLQDLQDQFSLQQLQSAQRTAPISEEILNEQLAALKRNGAATPEQMALINQAKDAGIASGNINIDRSTSEAYRQIRDELAPSLGLNPNDTPILDRAGLVAAEAVRQKGELSSNLTGAAATAQLNFPLAVQQVQSGIGLASANAANSLAAFQQELTNQATTNRLNLFGTTASATGGVNNGGLNLANIGPSPSTLYSLTQARLAGTVRDTSTNASTVDQIGTILSGIGAISGGVGKAGSSRSIKEGGRPVDPAAILRKIAALPVERWRYIGEDAEHVGPYAEDFRQSFDLGDGKTIDFIDAVGLLFAAVGELARAAEARR